jgi:hypothetical protein
MSVHLFMISPLRGFLLLDALRVQFLQVSFWRCARSKNRPAMLSAQAADEADK